MDMLPNLFHLSNTPVGTTSAHCANFFESKWDRLAHSIAKRRPCDPTDRSDPRYRGCHGQYHRHVADTRFDANPRNPAFRKGDSVLLVDPNSPRDAWSTGVVANHEIDFDELTNTRRFRYVGEAVSKEGRVSVFSSYANGLKLVSRRPL